MYYDVKVTEKNVRKGSRTPIPTLDEYREWVMDDFLRRQREKADRTAKFDAKHDPDRGSTPAATDKPE